MSESKDLIPPVPLWKFLSLAPGQQPPWQNRLQQLLNGDAYFPSPLDFNDPFDSLPHLRVPVTKDEITDAMPYLISRFVMALDLPEGLVREKLQHTLQSVDPAELANTMNAGVAQISAEMGVFCLSETIDSVLMWSHYASNHTGIALRFRLDQNPRNKIGLMFKVKYQDARPHLDLFSSADLQYDIADALAMKAKFWEYEKEWRSIRMRSRRCTIKFDPMVIDAIAFGAKCSDENKRLIQAMAETRPMLFLRTSAENDTFGLRLIEER